VIQSTNHCVIEFQKAGVKKSLKYGKKLDHPMWNWCKMGFSNDKRCNL